MAPHAPSRRHVPLVELKNQTKGVMTQESPAEILVLSLLNRRTDRPFDDWIRRTTPDWPSLHTVLRQDETIPPQNRRGVFRYLPNSKGWWGMPLSNGGGVLCLPDGFGAFVALSGEVEFVGWFREGRRDGNGTSFWSNGCTKYSGEWRNDLYEGNGELYRNDGGLKYHGEWRNGERDGQGKYYLRDGTLLYQGDWNHGKAHGMGQQYFKDGRIRYQGGFRDNDYHGVGVRYDRAGRIRHRGLWRSKKRVRDATGGDLPSTTLCDGTDGGRVHKKRERERVEELHVALGLDPVPQCALCLGDMHHGDVSYAYVPCGHRVVCGQCAARTGQPCVWRTECVVCRRNGSLMRVFG